VKILEKAGKRTEDESFLNAMQCNAFQVVQQLAWVLTAVNARTARAWWGPRLVDTTAPARVACAQASLSQLPINRKQDRAAMQCNAKVENSEKDGINLNNRLPRVSIRPLLL